MRTHNRTQKCLVTLSPLPVTRHAFSCRPRSGEWKADAPWPARPADPPAVPPSWKLGSLWSGGNAKGVERPCRPAQGLTESARRKLKCPSSVANTAVMFMVARFRPTQSRGPSLNGMKRLACTLLSLTAEPCASKAHVAGAPGSWCIVRIIFQPAVLVACRQRHACQRSWPMPIS